MGRTGPSRWTPALNLAEPIHPNAVTGEQTPRAYHEGMSISADAPGHTGPAAPGRTDPTSLSKPASPLLGLPGAVAAAGLDAGVAWHYGDPVGEQRASLRGAILIDRSHHGVLAVSGPDRLTWLHTLTSQFLTSLASGMTTEALILSPQGHVEHHAGVVELDGTAYLDTEPGAAALLLAYLDGMRFWSKVEVRDATGDLARVSVAGPTAADVVAAALGIVPPVFGAATTAGRGWVRATADGFDVFVARAELGRVAAALTAAGARPAGSWAADALRIPTRRPRFGVDTDERTIPNEVAWMASAVHLEKGCYRGQETVARVHNLGRPPRRLAMLNLDGSADALPATGDAITTAEGRTVGRVGTVAHHHEDGPIALALIKRSVSSGNPLLAGGVDAALDPADDDAGADATPLSAIDRRAFAQVRRP